MGRPAEIRRWTHTPEPGGSNGRLPSGGDCRNPDSKAGRSILRTAPYGAPSQANQESKEEWMNPGHESHALWGNSTASNNQQSAAGERIQTTVIFRRGVTTSACLWYDQHTARSRH